MRTEESGSASDRSGMSLLVPNAAAHLLPAKQVWELNQEMQAIQTPYTITGNMSSHFKPPELVLEVPGFFSLDHL